MREVTCCFTGHRELPAQGMQALRRRLEETLRELIAQGFRYFGAGGALGFDTLAAQMVLALRREYPAVRLILVLPCRDQARGWNQAQQQEYSRIQAQADKVVYIQERYAPGCMHRRNRHLANASSVCVCYLTKQRGGTKYTVGYCRAHGVKVINLAAGQAAH